MTSAPTVTPAVPVWTPAMSFVEQRRRDQDERDAQRAADLPDFVRRALRIGADFDIAVYSDVQLAAVLTAIGGHNNYDPAAAVRLLGPLVGDAAQVRVHHHLAGPTLWFQVAGWTHQRIRARAEPMDAVRYTDEQRRAYAQQVVDAGRELRADEISADQFDGGDTARATARTRTWGCVGDRPYNIRLWWD